MCYTSRDNEIAPHCDQQPERSLCDTVASTPAWTRCRCAIGPGKAPGIFEDGGWSSALNRKRCSCCVGNSNEMPVSNVVVEALLPNGL